MEIFGKEHTKYNYQNCQSMLMTVHCHSKDAETTEYHLKVHPQISSASENENPIKETVASLTTMIQLLII